MDTFRCCLFLLLSQLLCLFAIASLTGQLVSELIAKWSSACLQVKRAGPRPPDVPKDNKPVPKVPLHVPGFGRGPRVYVGGVPDLVTEERVHAHFTQWGCVSDVYFPGAKGQKRLNYCFVTFDNQRNAERACSESARNLDGLVSFGLHVHHVAQHLNQTRWVPLRILLFTPDRAKAQRLSLLFNSRCILCCSLWSLSVWQKTARMIFIM